MNWHRKKADSFRVVNTHPEYAEALADIQRACFPALAEEELMRRDHFLSHLEIFPEGQFTIVDHDDNPVASSTDLICNIDLDHYQHRYIEAVGHNWLTTHDPAGDWLYGVDIGVHPDYRGQGLSRMLYDARKDLVRRMGLKGHVAGGLPVGYGARKGDMSIQEYIEQVTAGNIFDPTVSIQLRRGFTVHGIIENYVDDISCDNTGVLIVWHNRETKENG